MHKTNAFGYTFEIEPIGQDELKNGGHVEVKWADNKFYSGKYIKKLKKYHEIRIIEDWGRSTDFVRVPPEAIFKMSTGIGKMEGQQT